MMSPSIFYSNFVKEFKKKRKYALLRLDVTMEESLKMKVFNCFVKKREFFMTSQPLEHHKKWCSWEEEQVIARDDKNHAQWQLYSKVLLGRSSEYCLLFTEHNLYKINIEKDSLWIIEWTKAQHIILPPLWV